MTNVTHTSVAGSVGWGSGGGVAKDMLSRRGAASFHGAFPFACLVKYVTIAININRYATQAAVVVL